RFLPRRFAKRCHQDSAEFGFVPPKRYATEVGVAWSDATPSLRLGASSHARSTGSFGQAPWETLPIGERTMLCSKTDRIRGSLARSFRCCAKLLMGAFLLTS